MRRAAVRIGRLRSIVAAELPDTELVSRAPLRGAACVVETTEGPRWGRILAGLPEGPGGELLAARWPLEADQAARAETLSTEAEDLAAARRIVEGSGVEVLLTERSLDRGWAAIYYRCEDALPMGELRDRFASERGLAADWRQLGARRQAQACGGMGVCGRELCCSTFLRELEPVSLRAARGQGRSLDPRDTAGACGRLKCCLRYEHEDQPATPAIGAWVRCARVSGKVIAIGEPERSLIIETPAGVEREVYLREIEDVRAAEAAS